MKNKTTEVVFVLDRSGSMSGLESDTIGGFNAMIEKQKKIEGECYITTVLFDDKIELLHDRINLKDLKLLTNQDYYVRGSTSLLDAIGSTIHKVDRTTVDNVLFIITTDGYENSSREFNYSKVKTLIDLKTKSGWEFIFLGANLDSAEMAESVGIKASNTSNYHSDSTGTKLNYRVLNDAISHVRSKRSLQKGWKKEIEEDYQKRKKH